MKDIPVITPDMEIGDLPILVMDTKHRFHGHRVLLETDDERILKRFKRWGKELIESRGLDLRKEDK